MYPIRISPRVDIVFKAVFGEESRTGPLKALLNALLPLVGRRRIQTASIMPPEIGARTRREKEIVVDVHAVDERGGEYQIEMQMLMHDGLPHRMIDNMTRLYARQLKKGDPYSSHRPLICIWLLDFRLPDRANWLQVMRLRWDEGGEEVERQLLAAVVQLPVLRDALRTAGADCNEMLTSLGLSTIIGDMDDKEEQYRRFIDVMSFLMYGEEWDLDSLPDDPDRAWMKDAYDAMDRFRVDPELLRQYEKRIEYRQVEKDIITESQARGYKEGMRQGLQDGMQQGMQQGIREGVLETARRMIALKMAPELVAQATGLSPKEMRELDSNGQGRAPAER